MKKFGALIVILSLNMGISSIAHGNLPTMPPDKDSAENSLVSRHPLGIVPANRLVVFYGNFNSRRMGILGEYPAPELWEKLKSEVREWGKNRSLQAGSSRVTVHRHCSK